MNVIMLVTVEVYTWYTIFDAECMIVLVIKQVE